MAIFFFFFFTQWFVKSSPSLSRVSSEWEGSIRVSNDWLSSKDVQVYLQHSQISSFLVAINSTWSQGLFRTVRDAAAEPLSSTLGKQLFCLIYFALKCINLWKYWLVTISKQIKPGGYFLAKKNSKLTNEKQWEKFILAKIIHSLGCQAKLGNDFEWLQALIKCLWVQISCSLTEHKWSHWQWTLKAWLKWTLMTAWLQIITSGSWCWAWQSYDGHQ